jgi:hypothetical protein
MRLLGIIKITLRSMLLCGTALWLLPVQSQARKPQPHSRSARIAGEYYEGDGLGFSIMLKIDPKGAFTVEGATDTLPFTFLSASGSYLIRGGTLELTASKVDVDKSHLWERYSKLNLVSWGERIYLIPNSRLLAFCNDINLGDEPRNTVHGDFLLKEDDDKKPINYLPTLPGKWNSYLLKKPIKCSVTKVTSTEKQGIGPSGFPGGKIVEIVMNAGKSAGLLPGMVVIVRNSETYQKEHQWRDTYVKVRKVTKGSSIAEFTCFAEMLPVEVGAMASTHKLPDK